MDHTRCFGLVFPDICPKCPTRLAFFQSCQGWQCPVFANILYLLGELGAKPGTLDLVPGGIGSETRQTLENIQATLHANGSDMSKVVKCLVMLADINEWPAMNDVYRTFFSAPYPARSALGASGLALGARVEIECMARLD